jgi:hypothetical protein
MTDTVRITCGGPASPRNDYFLGEFLQREYVFVRNPRTLRWLPDFWIMRRRACCDIHSSIQSFCGSDLQTCCDTKTIRGSDSGRGSPCSPKVADIIGRAGVRCALQSDAGRDHASPLKPEPSSLTILQQLFLPRSMPNDIRGSQFLVGSPAQGAAHP